VSARWPLEADHVGQVHEAAAVFSGARLAARPTGICKSITGKLAPRWRSPGNGLRGRPGRLVCNKELTHQRHIRPVAGPGRIASTLAGVAASAGDHMGPISDRALEVASSLMLLLQLRVRDFTVVPATTSTIEPWPPGCIDSWPPGAESTNLIV